MPRSYLQKNVSNKVETTSNESARVCAEGEWGCTLIFLYTHMLGGFVWG